MARHGSHDKHTEPPGIGFRSGTPVETTERRVGELETLIVDPTTEQVTHLVVWDGAALVRRMVPVELVASADDKAIHLSIDTNRFEAQERFLQNRYLSGVGRYKITDPVMQNEAPFLSPYVLPIEGWSFEAEERVPKGEVALHLGADVIDRDGQRVGRLDEAVVDPADGQVAYLVLRRGHVFHRERVTVPVGAVDHYGADGSIHLSLTCQQVADSEPLPLAEAPGEPAGDEPER